MTTTNPQSLPLALHAPFSDAERFAISGFLAGYSGLTLKAYTLDLRQYSSYILDNGSTPVRRPARAHRSVRTSPRSQRQSPRHNRPTPVHRHLLLPLRRTRRPHRQVTRRPRPPAPPRLRITRHRTGPQRARRHARRRRPRRRPRPCPHIATRTQRTAGLRSARRQHRRPRPRTRTPHPHGVTQRRQDRARPTRAPHSTRGRSRHR